MKKSGVFLSLETLILIVFLFLNSFVFKIKNIYLFFGILVFLSILTYFIVGYEKQTQRNKKDVFLNILSYLLIYFVITYILGLATGFVRTAYSLRINDIFKNLFPYLIIILVREFFRYLYFCKAKESKLLIFLGLLFLVLLDVNLNIHLYDISKLEGLIKMVSIVVFPSISKNILLSYLTVKSGYKNTIFYSCVMELNKFFLPIFPDFGEYIMTLINVLFPLGVLFGIIDKFKFNEKRRIASSRYHSKNLLFYSIITFVLLMIIMLTSGYFKYYALTIGSGSMEKTISKGDVVIVRKLKQSELNKLKVKKHILVYNHDNKIIVHRLVKIQEIGGKTFYITKGDNNLTKDSYNIKPKDVIGVVSFKIKYIGYPTVSLNERLAK
ncbi:MAG: signal peptidase I [Bacilli bacterium]|nr:signal peptidase I [Bacilli bacterium]